MFENIKDYIDRNEIIETKEFIFWRDSENIYWFESTYEKEQYYHSDWKGLELMLKRFIDRTFVEMYGYSIIEELKNV